METCLWRGLRQWLMPGAATSYGYMADWGLEGFDGTRRPRMDRQQHGRRYIAPWWIEYAIRGSCGTLSEIRGRTGEPIVRGVGRGRPGTTLQPSYIEWDFDPPGLVAGIGVSPLLVFTTNESSDGSAPQTGGHHWPQRAARRHGENPTAGAEPGTMAMLAGLAGVWLFAYAWRRRR